MISLLEAIRSHASTDKTNAAFDDGLRPLSWAEAVRVVENTVDEIARRILSQRPIGLLIDHSTASAILLVALIEARIPLVPLPPYFDEAQRNAALNDAGAHALITSCSLDHMTVRFAAHRLQTCATELPRGTAVISFSSGSTNKPKGVCLSAAHLTTIATAVCEFVGPEQAGRHLPVLPFGILLEQVAGLFASLIAGGTYVPLPGRDIGLANPLRPDGLKLIDSVLGERITSLILVPEYLAALVTAMEASGTRLPQLNLVAVGGAGIAPSLLARANVLNLPVRQGYGMTEAGSVITLEDGRTPSTGNVGRSIGAHQVRLAGDGEIVIDGPMFLGLVGRPREPGPFYTGDIGRIDGSGCLSIAGRKSNLIVTSFGRNVSPEWLEELLTGQAEIAQALVRGDGDAALEALVVPAAPEADVATAIERVNGGLPGYARLASFRLVSPFTPANGQMTGNGRLRRTAIHLAHPKEHSMDTFFVRLIVETKEDQARFAMTPQLVAGLTGQISRADYINYLTEAYHHVRHTVPLMMEARSALAKSGNQLLVDALDEYIVEETGHEQWILDDIDEAGGDRNTTLRSDPAPATKAMVDHAYRAIREGRPAAFFGMVFVLEGTSVAMASHGASAVQQRLGLPATAFRYLNSHGALDQDHMKFFEDLMNRIDDPLDQEAIIATAKDMFRLFGGMFAAIELEGILDAA